MYKLLNNLINKIGTDKLLHCFLAGWLAALGFIHGTIWGVIVIIVLIILSFIKEWYIDPECDYGDIIWAVIGIILTTLIYIL